MFYIQYILILMFCQEGLKIFYIIKLPKTGIDNLNILYYNKKEKHIVTE